MPVLKVRQAEVGTDAVVGQGLHQRQGGACGNGRPRHGQGHLQHAAAHGGAQQARGFHQPHRAFAQGRAHQQVDVGVEAQHKQRHRAPEAAHVGPQGATPAEGVAQRSLQRAAELQRVGPGVGQHIGRHRQRQQQRPFQVAPAAEIKQRHQRGGGRAQHHHAQADKQRQPGRLQRVVGQHRLPLVAQHGQCRSVQGGPGAQHTQHGQRQQQAQRRQQQVQRTAHGPESGRWKCEQCSFRGADYHGACS